MSSKHPPEMSEDMSYEDYKKEIKIWSEFTELPPEKKGPAIYFSLKGKYRATVLAEVDFDQIKTRDGVTTIFDCLDRLYAKNKAESSFSAFDDFIKFKRPETMSIKDYIIEFNLKLKKIQNHDMALPEGVLAYYLLECANLTKEQTSLCRATCNNLTYNDMKTQIERIYITNQFASNSVRKPTNFQVEFLTGNEELSEEADFYDEYDQFQASGYPQESDETYVEVEETFYSRPSRRPFTYGRGNHSNRGYRGGSSASHPGTNMRCNYCKSIMHRTDSCPHLSEPHRPYSYSRGQRRNYTHGSFNRGHPKGPRYGAPPTHHQF